MKNVSNQDITVGRNRVQECQITVDLAPEIGAMIFRLFV